MLPNEMLGLAALIGVKKIELCKTPVKEPISLTCPFYCSINAPHTNRRGNLKGDNGESCLEI